MFRIGLIAASIEATIPRKRITPSVVPDKAMPPTASRRGKSHGYLDAPVLFSLRSQPFAVVQGVVLSGPVPVVQPL